MSEKEQEKKINHCRANVKKKQMAAAVADKEEKDTRHGRIMDERTAKHWTHARTHTHTFTYTEAALTLAHVCSSALSIILRANRKNNFCRQLKN